MPDLTPLNQENLKSISSKISSPSYNRSELKTGIVHLGVGGFHRSHQAFYTDQLLQSSEDMSWGICGIGLRAGDRTMSEILSRQSGLYSLIVRHSDGEIESRIIGAIKECIFALDDPMSVIQKIASSDTKIISLTITEGGYPIAPNGTFSIDDEEIQHDINNPERPKTAFGYIAAAMKIRMQNGLKGLTVLSCDNVQHNGDVTKMSLLSLSSQWDKNLSEWIYNHVSFPNSMVDRITPVTSRKELEYIEKEFGVQDDWPVTCEPFKQWIIEDNFKAGRPNYERLGVQFVSNVGPYEMMKLRLLNAGHSVLGIFGALKGYKLITDCMKDSGLVKLMRSYLDSEVTPVLHQVAGIDLTAYKDSIEERFSNPNIADSVSRICSESSAKIPKFIIPTILDNLECGGSIQFASYLLAAWCYYCASEKDDLGNRIVIHDQMEEKLRSHALKTSDDPLTFLKIDEVFERLYEDKRFVDSYVANLKRFKF